MPAPQRAPRQAQVGAVTEGREVASVADVGALIRQTRRAAGRTQHDLADQVGTTRQWVIRLERGHHTLGMGKVLDVLSALGLEMVAFHDLPPRAHRRPRSAAERRIAKLLD